MYKNIKYGKGRIIKKKIKVTMGNNKIKIRIN